MRRTTSVARWVETLIDRADTGVPRNPAADVWSVNPEQVPAPDRRGTAVPAPLHWPTRGLNFVLALLAIIALVPVFVLVAVLVKLTSRGPIFYLQERVGLDRRLPGPAAHNHRRTRDLGGAPFTIYKFRTMHVDAERQSGAVWAQQQDPRVTPVGRVLRQYRLDELPQLFNVLRGEMNIVGPRPERPTIFAELRGHISEYPLRQRAKPGITGLAQINHHYDRSLDDVRTKVSYDLEYIRRQSLREDLRIMLKTIPVILLRRGGW
jgi:lipopolysaccharide/colanic/teichoic acid biosynthesis glycosyltransferase